MHFETLLTGITHFAPLNNAVAIVDVARNTSIITTIEWSGSYKSNNSGDNDVYNVGFVSAMISDEPQI
jgi:hypothetical protein